MIFALAAPLTNPYEIFSAARRYWQAQHYPVALEYTVVVTVVESGKSRSQHYHLGYDGINGSVVYDPVSDEEREHPYEAPHGFTLNIPFVHQKAPVPPDALGVPVLAPTYGFGIGRTPLAEPPHSPTPAELVAEIRTEFNDPDPRVTPSPTPSPEPTPSLPEIAEVYAHSPTYTITLLGREDVDGTSAYHLKLVPAREPGRYRLRELWVDETTFAPLKLTEAINFEQGGGTTVPWTVTFSKLDGALYIARETALKPLRYRGRQYAQADVEIRDVHPVATFDRDLGDFAPADPADVLSEP